MARSWTTLLCQLPNELFVKIIDLVEDDPTKRLNLDDRAYLSRESFALPPEPPEHSSEPRGVGNFRLVCKQFAELGASYQWARVTTRFSERGFIRLRNIASRDHLARHVKKFSYMVPNFYVEGRDRLREMPPMYDRNLGSLDVAHFEDKARAQKWIIGTNSDSKALQLAARAFTSLQHLQILRLQDQEDSALLSQLRANPALSRLVELKWAPACSRSSNTLGMAFLISGHACSRVSIPALAVETPEAIATPMSDEFKVLTMNLTSLELHFDERWDLQNKMQELSGFFKELFTSARRMQAIHIGFPSHRPLDMPLENVFHHVKWDRLSAFGIQAWKLDAQEIISFLGRHRIHLRGLRLRDVLLNKGSLWADVLQFLREDMPQLEWVSLRRIGYTETFNRQWVGAEIPDDPPGGESDSDEEEEEDEDADDGADDDSDEDEEVDEDSDTDDGSTSHQDDDPTADDRQPSPYAFDMGFPPLPLGRTRSHLFRLNQDLERLSVNDLGDDGENVGNAQRKLWERWAVAR